MSAPGWLAAMVAGSVLVIVAGSRDRPAPAREAPRVSPETPWLTREAAGEIIGPDGAMGPLFAGVVLGGTAPSPEVRGRIAQFAKANNVEIDLEIIDEEVAAVRFEVTYGGCCGYEGADALALRMGRPKIGGGCFGTASSWIDDWAFAAADGVHARARVRVNRLMVRWEPRATLEELLERADGLLGRDRGEVSSAARERWKEIASGQYVLEMPYPFNDLHSAQEQGLLVVTDRRKIVEVSFSIREGEGEPVPDALESQWGRTHGTGETWTWRKPKRIVSARFEPDTSKTTVTLRTR